MCVSAHHPFHVLCMMSIKPLSESVGDHVLPSKVSLLQGKIKSVNQHAALHPLVHAVGGRQPYVF